MSEPIRLAGLSPSAFMTRGERSPDDAQARSFFDSALEQPVKKREDKGRLQPPGQPTWSWGRLDREATTASTPKPETSPSLEGPTNERADKDGHVSEDKSDAYNPTDPHANPRDAHSAITAMPRNGGGHASDPREMQTRPASTPSTDDEPLEPATVPAEPDKAGIEQKDVRAKETLQTGPSLHLIAEASQDNQPATIYADQPRIVTETENGSARHLADSTELASLATNTPDQADQPRTVPNTENRSARHLADSTELARLATNTPDQADQPRTVPNTENRSARHLADTAPPAGPAMNKAEQVNRPTVASAIPLQGEATHRNVQPPHRNVAGPERTLAVGGREATIVKEDGDNGRIRSIQQFRSPPGSLNPHRRSDNLAGQVTMLSKQATPAMAPAPTPLQLPTGGPSAQIVSALRDDGELAARLGTAVNQAQEAPASRPKPLHTIQIQLNPAALGRVTARLSISGTQLNVDLRVETSQARAQLSNDSDSIVKALKASGFEVDRVTVQLAPPSSNAGSTSMQDRGGGTLSTHGGEADQAGEDSHGRNAGGDGSGQERSSNEGTHQETARGGLYI